MSMPPPPKYTRNNKFLKENWLNYLRMSFVNYRGQQEEEYNTSAKIMAIYKKFPRRSSDPDPDRVFIINRARAYYASNLKHWREGYTDFPITNKFNLLQEIYKVCGISYSIADLGSYYLRYKEPEYEDPILEEWSLY
ncbi:hypothetical protein BOTNAR_0422g00030 [Botryotinia narcissicola]|uniref:Uncharacterized protein n=1 Tax=Botryotinia narcissicola TaxID=278944 RepID=A0A4Z1HQR9_9HELO|nr:hypothetical protein BOTNAR_0422g00030 [Botryotinia narcissicola]